MTVLSLNGQPAHVINDDNYRDYVPDSEFRLKDNQGNEFFTGCLPMSEWGPQRMLTVPFESRLVFYDEQEIKERTREVFEEYRPLIVEAAKEGKQPPYDKLKKALVAAILAVLVGAARRRADQVQDEMRLYVDGALLESELVEWSRNYSASRADQLVGYTQTLVNKARQTDNEEDFDRLVDRAFSERRSRDISWTEVTFAVSAGYMIMKRLLKERHDVVMDDIWFTQLDERVCPVCAPLHGTGRDTWGDQFADGPPAHPLCRCFTLPKRAVVDR